MTIPSPALEDTSDPTLPLPAREPLRRRLLVGSAYSFLATALGQGLGFVTSIVYARLLGSRDLGVLAIYAQITGLFIAIGGLGLSTPIIKFVAQLRVESAEKLERFLSTVMTVILAATLLSSAGLLLFGFGGGFGAYQSPELAFMLEIAAIFFVLNSLSNFGAAVLQGLQRIRYLSIVGIAVEALTVPVMLLFLSLLGLVGAALGGVALVAFSTILIFGSAWRQVRRSGIRFRLVVDRTAMRQLAGFSFPLIGSTFVVRLALLLQGSFLALYLGFSGMGLFRVASTAARAIAFVPGAISIPLLPAVTELYASAASERAKKALTTMLRIVAYVGFPFAVTLGLLAGPLIGAFYGEGFRDATALAFVLVLTGFVDIINGVAVNPLLGGGRTRFLMVLDVGQSLVVVIATVVFVNWFGLIGVGYAAFLSSIIYAVSILLFLQRKRLVDLPGVSPALGFASSGFAAVTLAVLAFNALTNQRLGALLILASGIATWLMMGRKERGLLLRLAMDFSRGAWGGRKAALPTQHDGSVVGKPNEFESPRVISGPLYDLWSAHSRAAIPRKTRICELSPYSLNDVSGVASVVRLISEKFVSQGCPTVVMTPDPAPRNLENGIVSWNLRAREPFRNASLAYLTMRRLWRERGSWQLLHAHQAHLATLAASVVARMLGRPVVTTFHLIPPQPHGIRRWLQSSSIALTKRVSVRQVYVSEHTRRQFRGDGAVIHNGVDVSALRAALGEREILRNSLNLNGCVIAFAGRMVRNKGYLDLLRAIRKSRDAGADVRLLTTGYAPEEEQIAAARLVRELGLEAFVVELGEREDHLRFLAAADVFILPSYDEGLPMALLEAMAAGLPAIVSDVGGMAELIEDGQEGFIVPAGDIEKLSDRIRSLCEFPEMRASMGQRALEKVRSHDANHVAAEYLSLFLQCFDSA